MKTQEILNTLLEVQRLFDEALPKFNWGASALDANAIRLLNETPSKVRQAIEDLQKETTASPALARLLLVEQLVDTISKETLIYSPSKLKQIQQILLYGTSKDTLQ